MRHVLSFVAGLLFVFAGRQVVQAADYNWPEWRGPDSNGHVSDTDLPQKWQSANVAWKTTLPGRGQSSPVVWRDRIFLTSATEGGAARHVLCLDSQGKVLWNKIAWKGEPEKSHDMNGYASATCTTDGQRVIAFFGKGGLHCYDLDGNHQWSRDLGQFAGPWGTAASPILVGDLVIQNCDSEAGACLLAVDKENGKTVWKAPRANLRGWSTPLVVDAGDHREIVVNGEPGVNAYDPATGNSLWFCRGDAGRGTPSVVFAQGLLVAVAGRAGDMIAVRPGGSGTVNESHEAWRTTRRFGRDLPSPVVVGDYLMVFSFRPGIAACYEVKTGKLLDRLRLAGNITASPVVANGMAYVTNENGETFVVQPGKKLKVVAHNRLDASQEEVFRASLSPFRGRWLCRSDRVLYCIGEPRSE